MFKLLHNQSGQVPGGFFWGGLLGGVGQGLRDISQQQREREQLAQQKKELGLREKLLGIQIEKEERASREAQQRQAGAEEFVQLLTQGAPQELELPGPGEGFAQAPMAQAPQPSTIPSRTPASREQLIGAAAKAQPKETISQFVKGQMPGATGTTMAFPTMAEAMAASQTPEFKALFPQGVRWRGTTKGFVPESFMPVNVPSAEYNATKNRALQMGATPEQAEALGRAAQQQALYGAGAATGAGQLAGRSAQELGEPVGPMVPMESAGAAPGPTPSLPPNRQAGPVPGTVAQAPTVAQGTYPTPAGGSSESPTQRALRQREAIKREEEPLPAALQEMIARGETLDKIVGNIKSSFKPEFLTRFAGPTELEYRRRFGSLVGMQPSGPELTFRQNLQSAQNLIVYLQTGKQINESEAGRLNAAMPQAYDVDPGNFQAGLDRFKQEMKTIVEEQRRSGRLSRGLLAVVGGPTGQPSTISNLPPPPTGWRPAQ